MRPMSSPIATNQSATDDDLELLQSGPARRSKAAVWGFILALVTAPPVAGLIAWRYGSADHILSASALTAAAGLVAAILGVIGILRTRRKVRRGRWLAIAAVVIGLLGGGCQILSGQFTYMLYLGLSTSRSTVRVLRTPRDQTATAADQWYDQFASTAFQKALPRDRFEAWLAAIISDHGQLQSQQLMQPIVKPRGNAQSYRYQARFVNGTAIVEVVVGFENSKAKVENLRVGDTWAIK